MNKQPIVNINFTGITDYLRDKDLEIANLKSAKRYCESEADFYRSEYNRLNDKVQKVINYINEDLTGFRKTELLNILQGDNKQ